MSRRKDRRAWASASTLGELGELTARWLEGDIGSHPGQRCRPDSETEPLVPTLAAVNRSGLVTISSQPGCDELVGGTRWRQVAVVEALADRAAADRLRRLAARSGLVVDASDRLAGRSGLAIDVVGPERRRRWRTDDATARAVTAREDRGLVTTEFGAVVSRRDLRGLVFGWCSRPALRALDGACQVLVMDWEWGRNDRLWSLLDAFAASENPPPGDMATSTDAGWGCG